MATNVPHDERCQVPRCKRRADLLYHGRRVCGLHFDRNDAEALCALLGIRQAKHRHLRGGLTR